MSRIGRFGATAAIVALSALLSSTVISPVVADDTAPVNGLVVSTTFDGETLPPALDSSPNNGIVATNDPVGFSWSFTAARDLVGAQIVQTLPVGWKWSTAATDALLADIAAYQSTATISADLRTLTATLSTSAGAAITLGPLRAIPLPAAENTSYIPSVEVSDSGGAATAEGTQVDVVSGAPRLTVQSSVNLSSSSPGSYNNQLGQTSQAIVTLSLPSYAGQPNIALPAGSQFTMTTAGAKPPTLTGYLGLANATQAGQVTTATIPYALQPGGSATYRLNYFWANSDLANSTVWLNYTFAIADFADFTLSSSSTTATGTNLRGAVTAPSGVWTTYSCQTGWTACDVQVASYNTEPNNLVAADALLRHTVTYSGVKDSTNRSVVEDTVTIGASWDRNVLRLADRPGPIQVRVIINGAYSTPDAVIEYYDAVDRAWVTTLDSSNLARYTEVRAILTTPWPAGVATPQVLLVVLLEGMVAGATQSAISGSWLSSWSGPEALPTKVIRKIRLVPLQDQATFTVSPSVLTAPGTLQYTGKVQIRIPAGGIAPQTGNKVTVTETFPPSVLAVSAPALDPSWTMTQTVDANNQIVATFVSGPVTATSTSWKTLPSIVVAATLSPVAPASRQLASKLTSSVANSLNYGSTTLTATATVNQAQVIALTTKAVARTVELGTSQPSWEIGWQNFMSTSQGRSALLAVLPFSGDAAGSHFSGSLVPSTAVECANATGVGLEYTTDDPADVQARDVMDETTTWTSVPFGALPNDATALRVIIDDFAPAVSCSLTVTTDASGNATGDRYALTVVGVTEDGTSLPRSVPATVDVVAATIAGRIVEDPAASGSYSASLAGFADIPVDLLTSGGTVVSSTTTDATGAYLFDDVIAGSYRVRVGTTALPTGFAQTFAPTMPFTVAMGAAVTGKNVGYIVYAPALSISQTHTLPETIEAGAPVVVRYTLTNTGNAPLSAVALTGANLTGTMSATWPATAGSLARSASAVITVTHVLTQAEVDAGSFVSRAGVTGTDPVAQKATDQTEQTISFSAHSALEVSVTGHFSGIAAAGAPVSWAFTARNTGAVTVTNVDITPTLVEAADLVYQWPTATAGVLAPGQSVTATGSSELTALQAFLATVTETASATADDPLGAQVSAPEVDTSVTLPSSSIVGRVVNDAEASGHTTPEQQGFDGATVTLHATDGSELARTTTDDEGAYRFDGLPAASYDVRVDVADLPQGASATVTPATVVLGDAQATTGVDFGFIVYAPSLTVTQTRQLPATIKEGEQVRVEVTVTNTGNGTLTGVALTDVSLGELVVQWPGDDGVLAPGASATATLDYTLTQADVDAGSLVSTVSASGVDPLQQEAHATSRSTITLDATGALEVEVVGLFDGVSRVGASVSWTFTARNVGGVTLTDVSFDTTVPALGALHYVWPSGGAVGRLAPGQEVTATATSTLTAVQVAANAAAATAGASGLTPASTVVTSDPAGAVIDLPSGVISGRVVEDPAALGTSQPSLEGFANVTVEVSSSDGSIQLTTQTGSSGTYTVTGLPAGDYDIAVEAADLPVGAAPTFAPTGPIAVGAGTVAGVDFGYIVYRPALSIVAHPTVPDPLVAGAELLIRMTLTNTGNAPLTAVTVDSAAPAGATVMWPGAEGELLPGGAATLEIVHVLTQSEVNAGVVATAAEVHGMDPVGQVARASVAQDVTLTTTPSLTVSVSGAFTGRAVPGASVGWTIVVTNSGPVTLNSVTMPTPAGLTDVALAWPSGASAGTLEPGRTVTMTGVAALTEGQVAAHAATLTASATARTTLGGSVESGSVTSTVALPAGSIAGRVVNDAHATGVSGSSMAGFAGVEVSLLTATGTPLGLATTLSDGRFTFGGLPDGEYRIEVNESDLPAAARMTFDSGAISVSGAVASGSADVGYIVYEPGLTVTTHPSMPGTIAAGERVPIEIEVANTGNGRLTEVVVGVLGANVIDTAWPGDVGTLAVGESATLTVEHVLTQEEVDAGAFSIVLNAEGTDPIGTEARRSEPVQWALSPRSAVDLTGSGEFTGLTVVDAPVAWQFTVTNSGAVTLTDVTIASDVPDMSPIAYAWPVGNAVGVLAPGQSATVTFTSRLTSAQIDELVVHSVTTATGLAPGATPVSSAARALSVTLPRAEGFGVDLASDGVEFSTAPGLVVPVGTRIEWSYLVTNAGSRPLSGIVVALSDDSAELSSPAGFAGTLAPGESAQFDATVVAEEGQHELQVTVTGFVNPDDAPALARLGVAGFADTVAVSASATAYYRGDAPASGSDSGGSGALARTGLELGGLLSIAFVLGVLGLAAVGAGRRRRAVAHSVDGSSGGQR